jgi:peptidoglycan/xylan/chitin deacetylase (PgdA/CDA1 family)
VIPGGAIAGPGGGLYAEPGSPYRGVAEAIGWLWRLPVADAPAAGVVGIGGVQEAESLAALARGGGLAGAVVFAAEPGPESGPVPARRAVEGVARLGPGGAVAGSFTVFDRGRGVVSSNLGAHAVSDANLLVVGFDPAAGWGRLSLGWALQAVQAMLVEAIERPLVCLPPLGCLRFDDLPGTAQQQLQDTAKPDGRVRRRIERLREVYAAAGARLSVAVAARALAGGEPVPTEEIWPESTAALARGVQEGTFEPVCHGLLHYDAEASHGDHVEPREFAALSRDEAGRRLDAALEWHRSRLGEPRTFVAPAWGYSEGALAAAAERGLPAWHRAAPEPLIVAGNPRETLIGAGGVGGVHRLDYGSLVRLAEVGVPPTPVLHGGLLDDRLTARVLRDALGYARLLWRRDALRLPRVGGVGWVGAGDLVERLAAHDRVDAEREPAPPEDGDAVLVSRHGRTLVRG